MSDEELAKDLGLISALAIGIGTMIGAGIFVLPGIAAQEAGPAVIISFIIGGLIAMINAFSVSELGTAMPKAGGAYYYINRALGPLFGSISGMGDWIGLAFASAFYAIGFGGYLADLLDGVVVPIPGVGELALLPTIAIGSFVLTEVQIGAVLAGIVFVAVNYMGAKETGGIQTAIVTLLLGILTVFTIVGFFSFDWSTVTVDGSYTPEGTGAILPGAALVFVSYLGYAKIATIGEELKNPGRNLPIAIIGSVGIVMAIYTIIVGLLMGLIPHEAFFLDTVEEAPMSYAAEIVFDYAFTVAGLEISLLGVGVTSISVGALLATASSANASILASARINFAMGRDKIVSDKLNAIHPRFATPYRSIAITGAMIIVFIVALGETVEILSSAASILHLVVYALINASLIVFRETNPPEYDPDFEVPFYPYLPISGFFLSLALIYFMDNLATAIAGAFVVFAVAWYFWYARTETELEGILGSYILDRSSEMPDAAVSAASAVRPSGGDEHTVVVPVSNPRTESNLLSLASVVAKANDGVVKAVHVVEVPDQTPLQEGSEHVKRIDEESQKLMEQVRESTETLDVPVEVTTVASHRGFEQIFDIASQEQADTVVMGWGPGRPWSAGRAEGPIDELTHDLPCDFLVFDDEGLETDRVLVPTAGGPDSVLSAEIARDVCDQFGSEVTLLHVVGDESEREAGETFLTEWASEHSLEDATIRVDVSGDIEGAIADAAEDHSLLVIGATERGLLSRLLRGSLAYDVVNDVDCSVVLAERPTERSLWERLFAR
ncbi:amino acid permease [Natronobacterium gregoryi]|uniref:Amino acid permease n=2 Tax=Natronobacterium gregoryi TaxID=44930 RepID=L0AEG8_NATGS|nr:amino acid permease [Natronobacterium gregoryi]AFZ71455.1 amino acid transporter [Natronobacterium gregoryi SP2]ELY66757.1 amino acid permease-associated protein [Natronobacterium gregoryi SP2]PLK19951.1 amino acid permease [Natronobacterium gregoryi SP2]SFJ36181.1 amino acid/polyamine/organocation transporter, APC superfamily [Natronobacterium gregoryi]